MVATAVPATLIVGLSLTASALAILLIRYLFQYTGRPGANWFIGAIAAVAVFSGSYGTSLVISDPEVRVAFEAITFVSLCFMGPFFLGFGLDYSGRSGLIRSPVFAAVMAVPLVTTLVAATTTRHGMLWTGFRIDPVFGLSTVVVTLQPWAWFALGFGFAVTGVGVLLLVEAILDYGTLYRREAAAVVLSIVPPSIGLVLWMFQLGPVPQLNLTPILFIPHLLLDGYAFVGTRMFETSPTTQRAAEQATIVGRSEPQLTVDTEGRIVQLNPRAVEVFGIDAGTPLPIPIEEVTGASLPTLLKRGDIEVDEGQGGVFAISHTPLSDPQGNAVGDLLVFYDITEERRRKQQLAVLNRILRHNLRNEMTVINGYAEVIAENESGTETGGQAKTIAAAGRRLVRIAEKVRTFDTIQDGELNARSVDVEEVVQQVRGKFMTEYPAATVTVTDERSSGMFSTDRDVLSVIVSTYLENAIVHAEDDDPRVDVRLFDAADQSLGIEIRDRNERIPPIETDSLRAGDETPLQHGRGIGLWVATWCLAELNGDVAFGYDDGNVVTVTIPPR